MIPHYLCSHLRGNILNRLIRTSSSQPGPLGLRIIPEENHEESSMLMPGFSFNFNTFVVILMSSLL